MSLISLVDDDRQWFKARIGFEPQETSLDRSVCSHALLQSEFLEIEDMAADARTSDNPLHTGEDDINYYAGANLIAPNGMSIGTLCVLDNKPRKLSAFQREALQTLSRQVMVQLELRKKIREEEALRSEMDHRVRNSLQTIVSIMRMASRGVNDPAAIEVLELVERRLGAVASLHTELMGSEGKGSVDTKNYLERVAKLLADVAPNNIAITINAVDAVIDARKASAIGMIISEFVANSIKHAFPDGRNGAVEISLTKDGKGHWSLVCQDDGVGRQEKDDAMESDSTGLGEKLISAAAAQLDSQIEYDTKQNGTVLTVDFSG